jgi:hypothetical protein
MSNEIELISDGDGLAVIGSPADVGSFLESLNLKSKDLPLDRAKRAALLIAATTAQSPEIFAASGRWVKLTEESARKIKEIGLISTEHAGIKHAVLGTPGDIRGWIQIVSSPTKIVANPAFLSGVAGLMAQSALHASLKEISEYLQKIDLKLDDVIRAQTNAVLARVDAVRSAVDEANAIKEAVGKVSEVTWSKIQNSSTTLLETQSFALRQIQDEVRRINLKSPVTDMYQAIKTAETQIPMWLTVLANCVSLYDSIAIIELDRVMETNPEDLESHRIGLKAARTNRLQAIAKTLDGLLGHVSRSVERANERVLFNPFTTPRTIESCRSVELTIVEASPVFSFSAEVQTAEARRWVDAASERIEATRKVTADTAVAVQNASKEAVSKAKVLKGKVSEKLAERRRRPDEIE